MLLIWEIEWNYLINWVRNSDKEIPLEVVVGHWVSLVLYSFGLGWSSLKNKHSYSPQYFEEEGTKPGRCVLRQLCTTKQVTVCFPHRALGGVRPRCRGLILSDRAIWEAHAFSGLHFTFTACTYKYYVAWFWSMLKKQNKTLQLLRGHWVENIWIRLVFKTVYWIEHSVFM